jgi:biopolymer transport protein ExbB/TolQ
MATTTTDGMTQAGPRSQNGHEPAKSDSYSYLLLLRFCLLNIAALALLAAAWGNGLVARAFESDTTRLVFVIAAVFVAGLSLAFWRVFETSRELNRLRRFDPAEPSLAAAYVAQVKNKDAQSRQILASSLRLKLSQRITLVRHIGSSLVFLGLIGTVIGFIIALSGVDPETVGDVDKISIMAATLIQGMSTALMTTLVGAVLNIWLMANYQLLATGTVKLITAVVELGEDRATA